MWRFFDKCMCHWDGDAMLMSHIPDSGAECAQAFLLAKSLQMSFSWHSLHRGLTARQT